MHIHIHINILSILTKRNHIRKCDFFKFNLQNLSCARINLVDKLN